MEPRDLRTLHAAVEWLVRQTSFPDTVERLKAALRGSSEPFVWSTLDLAAIPGGLPAAIKSGWIFLLRADRGSGCHYHPNSVQHMIAVNGRGRSVVGGVTREIVPFAPDPHSIEAAWHVIDRNVPHEFFPEREDMAVVSFHTCEAAALEEVSCETGANRLYEPPPG